MAGADKTDELVLKAIKQYIWDNGFSPRLVDISNDTGVSIGGIEKAVKRLERQGLIRKRYRKFRSIEII